MASVHRAGTFERDERATVEAWHVGQRLIGDGVKPGMTYGATDELGFHVVENPAHVHDMQATILQLLGFDHEKLTYHHAGRDFRLTDVHEQVVRALLA